MKLGTETGSLVNHVSTRGATGEERPEIGDGATRYLWTDRHAYTVIDVKVTPKRCVVTVQRDHAERVDANGMSEVQEYTYTPDPEGQIKRLTFRRGAWRPIGASDDGSSYVFGHREEYYDYSF